MFLLCFIFLSTATSQADPLATLRQNVLTSLLPGADDTVWNNVSMAATRYASMLQQNGSWSDIDYTAPGRSWWPAGVHLYRTLLISTSLHRPASTTSDTEVVANMTAVAVQAITHWVQQDYQQQWWWMWIGVPRAVAKIVLLIQSSSNEGKQAMAQLMPFASVLIGRANYSHPGNPNEGTNLVWMASARILNGIITNNITEISVAYNKSSSTININEFDEGVQEDNSWHQHGPQLYSGWGYGAIWSTLMITLGNAAAGTPFEFNADVVESVSNIVLDGQAWMTAGPNFDYTTCGRLMTYFTNNTGPEHLNFGHYHYYAAFTPWSVAFPTFKPTPQSTSTSLYTALAVNFRGLLSSSWVNSWPRNAEAKAYASQINNPSGGIKTLEGNRHYWNSDYHVHRRTGDQGFMVSVRMVSNRTINTECGNDENKQGQALADGVTNVYLTGREYEDVYPVWDWSLVPGTTEQLKPPPTDLVESCNEAHISGHQHFVGGVSDGMNGMVAMDYVRGPIRLHRAWALLDDIVVCVASGFSGSSEYPIVTTWDQRLLNGDVSAGFSNGSSTTIPYGEPAQIIPNLSWLHHDSNLYFPLTEATMVISAREQIGAWFNITQGDNATIRKDVFSAYIKHDDSIETNEAIDYAYVISPQTDIANASKVKDSILKKTTVTNTWNESSVCITPDSGAKYMFTALWYPNSKVTSKTEGCWDLLFADGGNGAPNDQGIIVMIKTIPNPQKNSIEITVANPHNCGGNVTLELSGKYKGSCCTQNVNLGNTEINVQLPENGLAGNSTSCFCTELS
eukprot:m.88513 g.88513  ORF g.88513 m.88513 type:complete len:794 (-) comp13169_c1_seq3:1634-4015(-)